MTKCAAYDDEGVAAYWIVEPDPDRPSIEVFVRTEAGRLVPAGAAVGDAAVHGTVPFAVDIVPSALVADLRQR
jgi:hypothetical protein